MVDARNQAGYTADRLANETGTQRQKISHIETARKRVSVDVIQLITRHLGVNPTRAAKIMNLAKGSAQAGWWERFDDEMGPRQAHIAGLEAGAVRIVQHQPALVPGLLQMPEFARVRAEADRPGTPRRFSAARMVEARTQRQAILLGADAVTYEVIIDEAVLHRHLAPPQVMQAQLTHLIGVTINMPAVTVRILPLNARVQGYAQARTEFSVYTYQEPEALELVTVDTNVEDLMIAEPATVAGCVEVKFDETGQVSVRDSKNPDALTLRFTGDDFQELVCHVRYGHFGGPVSFTDHHGRIEVRFKGDGLITIADAEQPGLGVLTYNEHEIGAFVAGVKAGEFDHQPSESPKGVGP
ncbi:Scr1 family TA system antitoxin-like transcriptional regulator [Actinoplanes sp. GCM10030250]|uniref:Scr1 family TA system antitoxin-like transcriptional regulator n=1 Tax=Actinoplanes sp. GCM10030250 TaxID=3273376 RepID=UPI003623E347